MIGINGAIFAAPTIDENPSTVYYKTHDSSLSKSEWQIYLPGGEDVIGKDITYHRTHGRIYNLFGSHLNTYYFYRSIGVALTKDAAIVATSRGFVRIFSQSGVQTGIFSVGSIVAIAGLHDLAIIIYHQGEPFEGNTDQV